MAGLPGAIVSMAASLGFSSTPDLDIGPHAGGPLRRVSAARARVVGGKV